MNRLTLGLRPRAIHHVGTTDAGRKREPAGERLAEADHIRHDPKMLRSKPTPRAAEPGVHLVANEQRTVFVADFPKQLEETGWGDVRAATALNRLDKDGANLLSTAFEVELFFQLGQVDLRFRERHEAGELAKLPTERRTKFAAPGCIE